MLKELIKKIHIKKYILFDNLIARKDMQISLNK